ncbi:carbohydrate ABC transporter permease [Jiangella endophytica]|uniref:carbohydrate ABC transporter permease n=1 Tax=Jiangella endophytica TaxID=1623398 RepID=UPI0018E4EB85|nr:sugar ABC transporter permease [Jiangella endophytica]
MTSNVAGVGSTEETQLRRRPRWRSVAPLYLALLPLALVLGVVEYYPALSGIWYSFFDWNPGGDSPFIGLDNYSRMMGDHIWWQSFRVLGAIFLFAIASWVFPLLGAELLISLRNERAAFVYRTLLIAPMAFPGVVTALVWSFMYHPNDGVINTMLTTIGLGNLAQNWLGDPSIALIALLFVGFPFVAGLQFLVFYSTLQNVPKEIFEAAGIDGVGRLRRFWHIDLPLMATQVRLLFVLTIINTLQYGFVAYLLTAGGPDNATMVPVLRMLNVAFQGQDWGFAAALSTTLFLLTLAFSAIAALVGRRSSISNVRGRR